MKKDPRVYLAQILECVERIESYVAEGKEVFMSQLMMQDAVIRNFEVIGEATKRIPEDYRQKHREIPWKSMAAFRDVLIHDYERISSAQIWKTIERELPSLKEVLKAVLPPLDQLEAELAGQSEDDGAS